MYIDMNGVKRYKINLHTHTTASDGRKTPGEAIALYGSRGYDMIALTDHWVWNGAGNREVNGQKIGIVSGCEYHFGGGDSRDGVFHIVALDCAQEPDMPGGLFGNGELTTAEKTRIAVTKIREAGGLAVLAHPAWSLNNYAQMISAAPFDATEIYNSVSDWGMSCRPYSGLAVDELAANGIYLPLLATDDTHYYDGDECRGYVMAEAEYVDRFGIAGTIRANRFYATNGPEIHLERVSEEKVRLTCSPCVSIAFLSHIVHTAGRMTRGENLTGAEYTFASGERYVRAEVTDREGRRAFSPIIIR